MNATITTGTNDRKRMSAKYQAGMEAIARNKEEALRLGKIKVVRARSGSVFNYWKDCLVSGFRSAAGIEGIGADLQDPGR